MKDSIFKKNTMHMCLWRHFANVSKNSSTAMDRFPNHTVRKSFIFKIWLIDYNSHVGLVIWVLERKSFWITKKTGVDQMTYHTNKKLLKAKRD